MVIPLVVDEGPFKLRVEDGGVEVIQAPGEAPSVGLILTFSGFPGEALTKVVINFHSPENLMSFMTLLSEKASEAWPDQTLAIVAGVKREAPGGNG